MSDNEAKVLNCITNSFPLPITRPELSYLTGLKDRCVRRSIQKLRHGDHWIYSCSSVPGYRLTRDAREWDSFVDNWNLGNKYNMLKKSGKSESQQILDDLYGEGR